MTYKSKYLKADQGLVTYWGVTAGGTLKRLSPNEYNYLNLVPDMTTERTKAKVRRTIIMQRIKHNKELKAELESLLTHAENMIMVTFADKHKILLPV